MVTNVNPPWTQDELNQLRELYLVQGMMAKDVAQIIGRSYCATRHKINQLKLFRPRRSRLLDCKNVRDAFECGESLKKVAKRHHVHHISVSQVYRQLSEQIIDGGSAYTPGTYIGAKEMAGIVAPILGVTVRAIFSPSRYQPCVHARTAIARALRDRGLSLPVIGRRVNRSDHSTILHCLSNFDEKCRLYPRLAMAYQAIKDAEAAAAERLAA